MFEFRTGLPGSGKSLSLVRDIYWKLVYTNRLVLTTLTELDVGKLTSYIAQKHPNKNFNIDRRLFFIPKSETSEFYRYRGVVTLPPPPVIPKTCSQKESDAICEQYFSALNGLPGVDYVLTEAHRHFRADTWSEMAAIITFYASQHRHFDDNAIVETQVPKMVVVQFRDLAELCCELQNHYRQRFGAFQKIGRFVGIYYYGVPKPGSKGEESHRITFTLDKAGLASCYRTRGAVTGVGGSTPETENIKKGLPFWLIIPGGVAILAFVVVLIWNAGALFQWALPALLGRFLPKTVAARPAHPPEASKPAETIKTAPAAQLGESTPPEQKPPLSIEKDKVVINSVAITKERYVFVLSDGTVLHDRLPEMQGARFDKVAGVLSLKNGVRYYLKR